MQLLRAQADIPPGDYSLYFDVNGDDYRGGIDNVLVTPAACPQMSTWNDDVMDDVSQWSRVIG